MRPWEGWQGQHNRSMEWTSFSRKSSYGSMLQILIRMEPLILSSLFLIGKELREITGSSQNIAQDLQSTRDVNGELKKWIWLDSLLPSVRRTWVSTAINLWLMLDSRSNLSLKSKPCFSSSLQFSLVVFLLLLPWNSVPTLKVLLSFLSRKLLTSSKDWQRDL